MLSALAAPRVERFHAISGQIRAATSSTATRRQTVAGSIHGEKKSERERVSTLKDTNQY